MNFICIYLDTSISGFGLKKSRFWAFFIIFKTIMILDNLAWIRNCSIEHAQIDFLNIDQHKTDL
jgi:hypothetical protein